MRANFKAGMCEEEALRCDQMRSDEDNRACAVRDPVTARAQREVEMARDSHWHCRVDFTTSTNTSLIVKVRNCGFYAVLRFSSCFRNKFTTHSMAFDKNLLTFLLFLNVL